MSAVATICMNWTAPAGSIPDEVARLKSLGATVLDEGEDLTVMLDPEGNEFCVE